MQNDLAVAFRAGRERYDNARAKTETMRALGKNLQANGIGKIKSGIVVTVGVLLLILMAVIF